MVSCVFVAVGTLALLKHIIKQIYVVFSLLCRRTVGVVEQTLQSTIYCIKRAGCSPTVPSGDTVVEQQMCKMGEKA